MIVEWEFLDNGTMRVKTPALEGERILPKYVADVFKTKEIIRTQDITQNGYSSIEMPSLDENTRLRKMMYMLMMKKWKLLK